MFVRLPASHTYTHTLTRTFDTWNFYSLTHSDTWLFFRHLVVDSCSHVNINAVYPRFQTLSHIILISARCFLFTRLLHTLTH